MSDCLANHREYDAILTCSTCMSNAWPGGGKLPVRVRTLPAALAGSVESWSGVPVTWEHPTTDDGEPILLCDGGECYRSGEVLSAEFDGAVLWGRVRLFGDYCTNLITTFLDTGRPVAVSIGYSADKVEGSGGEYDIKRLTPDHLALVAQGACEHAQLIAPDDPPWIEWALSCGR